MYFSLVSVVSFRSFRFVVSGFSACLEKYVAPKLWKLWKEQEVNVEFYKVFQNKVQ